MLVNWVLRYTERGLRPYALRTFLFAVLCVAAATALHFGVNLINPDTLQFAAFFPAVLVVAMLAGAPAALFAMVLSIAVAALVFAGPAPDWRLEFINYVVFAGACLMIVLIAETCRQLVKKYQLEEHQKNLMLHELEHRGKNMRAVVEAIVMQTLSGDRATAETLAGRIRAVASANDIISHADNLQPDLRLLIESKFTPFGYMRANLNGPAVTLNATVARNLSLVVHELVTNAIKHGALSVSDGWVEVSWVEDSGGLSIRWSERNGPNVTVPEKRGFGSRLIAGCMKTLGGKAETAFNPDGLVCTLIVPGA